MSHCRSCQAEVIWAVNGHRHGTAVVPVDPIARPDGNVSLERVDGGLVAHILTLDQIEQRLLDANRAGVKPQPLYVTHFATCPNAQRHRRGRAQHTGGNA